MKTITILSAILFLSFTHNTTITFDKCMVKLTKEDLLADKIELHCQGFADNEKFSIKNFTIKFPSYPPVVINGEKLDEIARSYVENLKINQMISIYDIKSTYQEDVLVTTKNIPSFYVKIIEKENAVVMND